MSSGGYQRELDLAPTATIDKVALNNKVVLMRAIVRRSKLHLINGLVKKVHKLRDKKGSEDQKKQNKNKADKMLEDIKIIKVLKPDYVSKYALGTTVKFEELAAKASTTPEMRALARLAAHKFIMQEVDKFRQAHEDWKDLAAYLMTKHTSRDFKKKKTKETRKKVEANVLASENLVQKYLGQKLEGRTDLEDVENEDDVNGGDDDEVDASSNENEDIDERIHVKNNIRNMNERMGTLKKTDSNQDQESDNLEAKNSDGGKIIEDVDDDDDDDNNNDSNDDDNNIDSNDDDNNNDYDDDDDNNDEDDETIQDMNDKTQFSKIRKREIDTKERVTKKTKGKHKDPGGHKITENIPKKSVSAEKVEGEMIVKKLNLAKDFVDDDIPKILLSDNEDKQVKHKRKRKDLFFDTGEDHDSGNQDGDENEINDSGDHGNEVLENDARENYERSIQPTMTAFTTCFVGSLKSSDMMGCNDSQYRSNEDWKRIRHETKEQKFGSGRGQGPVFRGRGSSNSFMSHRGRGFSEDPRGRGFAGGPRGRGFSDGPRGRVFSDGPRGRGFSGDQRGRGFSSRPHDQGFGGRGGGPDRGRVRFDKGQGGRQPDQKKSIGLHPSWEASKKRKQEQKAVLQAFEGKKIKFDD